MLWLLNKRKFSYTIVASCRIQAFIADFDFRLQEGILRLLGLYGKTDSFDKSRVVGNIEQMLDDEKYDTEKSKI